MTRKDRRLIFKSVRHWERMRDAQDCKEEPWGDDCPLCEEYAPGNGEDCLKCPISLSTGKDQCMGTPWLEAKEWWMAHKPSRWDRFGKWNASSWRAWQRRAQKMIDFLKSLLEDKDAQK